MLGRLPWAHQPMKADSPSMPVSRNPHITANIRIQLCYGVVCYTCYVCVCISLCICLDYNATHTSRALAGRAGINLRKRRTMLLICGLWALGSEKLGGGSGRIVRMSWSVEPGAGEEE